MKTTSIREFRSRIAELIDGDEPVLVTRHGKNAAVLYPLRDPKTIPAEIRRRLFRELTDDIARQLDTKEVTDADVERDFADFRSVAADRNVLLSALARRAAWKVFEAAPDLIVVTTEETIAEVEEYLPVFAERYGLDIDVCAMRSRSCRWSVTRKANTHRTWQKRVGISTRGILMMCRSQHSL